MMSLDKPPRDQRPWWSYIIYYNKNDPRTFIPRWGGVNVTSMWLGPGE